MMILLGALLLPAAQVDRMEELIDSWRSDVAEDRADAYARVLDNWKRWSDADVARLERAMEADDLEVAALAREAHATVSLRRKLGDKILRTLPRAETAFRHGSDEDQIAVLRQARRSASWGNGTRGRTRRSWRGSWAAGTRGSSRDSSRPSSATATRWSG
jgi:hypothetical protein